MIRRVKDRQAEGLHATNAEYLRYDQVDKTQRYHLAESADEAFDEDFRIRTCDLGRLLHGDAGDRRRFADELGEALEGIGFAILDGARGGPVAVRRRPRRRARPLRAHLRRRPHALPRPAPRLGEPGLLPHQGDERHPSRPRRRLGLLPPRVRSRRVAGGAMAGVGVLALAGVRARIPPTRPRPRGAHPAGDARPPRPPRVRPAPLRRQARGHELRPAAQLLPAPAAKRTRGAGLRGCSATRTSTSSRSCPRRKSRGCRS